MRRIILVVVILIIAAGLYFYTTDELVITPLSLSNYKTEPSDTLKEGLKQDGFTETEIEEMVFTEIVNDQKQLKLYRVQLDYKWLDGVAIIYKDEYKTLQGQMMIGEIYMVKSRGKLGILTQGTFGSGMLYNTIHYYDLKSLTAKANSYYNNMHSLILKAEDNKIMVYSYNINIDRMLPDPIGPLSLNDLTIKNLEPFKLEE